MDTIAKRIAALEEELESIKSLIARPDSRLLRHIRSFAKFLLAYWVLLSLASAAVTAGIVKYQFNIDYFEAYRDQSTTKKLSELYRQLGDRMMARVEWDSAANAYKEAIKINSHNEAATSGLVKAQVFLPEAAEKFTQPEVIDVKLQYLEGHFPDDFMVLFLKGLRNRETGDYDAAQESLERSIAMNPDFPGAYLALGYLKQGRPDLKGAIESAIENFKNALKLDPQYPNALNNLGFLELHAGRYPEAIEHLVRAQMVSPRFVTAVNLGDAYRYNGDHREAADEHVTALGNATNAAGYDRYLGSEWTFAFLPLAADDTETIKGRLTVQSRDQKFAVAHFALALDYAAVGNISDANSELEKAVSLERQHAYRAFYVNKIDFMQRSPALDGQTRKWLAEQRAKLLPK
jgi:tetratricopeptide (TPR) repeat protein